MIGWRAARAFLVAETFKLRRSWLAVTAFLTMCGAPLVAIGIVAALGSQAAVFPTVAAVIGMLLWLLSGMTSLLLAAGSVGSEYQLGTVNVAVGRGTPRLLFMAGKAAVLLGAAVVNATAVWFVGGIAAVASHLINAGTDGLGDGLRLLLTSGLLAVGIAVLASAAYTGLVMAIGVVVRSSSYAMFGGLGLFMVDLFLGELTPVPDWQDGGWGTFSILGNVNLLLNQLPDALGADWTASADRFSSAWGAVCVLACYAVGGAVAACVLFQRQDLRGKT